MSVLLGILVCAIANQATDISRADIWASVKLDGEYVGFARRTVVLPNEHEALPRISLYFVRMSVPRKKSSVSFSLSARVRRRQQDLEQFECLTLVDPNPASLAEKALWPWDLFGESNATQTEMVADGTIKITRHLLDSSGRPLEIGSGSMETKWRRDAVCMFTFLDLIQVHDFKL